METTISQPRLSELLGALSYGLDITEGLPRGHSARACLIGMRIARELGLSESQQSSLFYALLLKDAGCSSNASEMCKLFDADDLALKRNSKTVDWSSPLPTLAYVKANAAPDQRGIARAGRIAVLAAKAAMGATKQLIDTRCNRGADIARIIGLDESTATAIINLDEHWNGQGEPMGTKGEAIPLYGRILCISTTAEVYLREFGLKGMLEMVEERSGTWFDPALCKVLMELQDDRVFWETVSSTSPLNHLGDFEPESQILYVDDQRLDNVALAFAKVVDAKSEYTLGHSERVAVLADGIGRQLKQTEGKLQDLRRAALLHDIGMLGISNKILEKKGALTDDEINAVQEHTQSTYDILILVKDFRNLAVLASSHHEKLDGSGYHRGLGDTHLSRLGRILVVAEKAEAMSSERPHRGAMAWGDIMQELQAISGSDVCPTTVQALQDYLTEVDFQPYAETIVNTAA